MSEDTEGTSKASRTLIIIGLVAGSGLLILVGIVVAAIVLVGARNRAEVAAIVGALEAEIAQYTVDAQSRSDARDSMTATAAARSTSTAVAEATQTANSRATSVAEAKATTTAAANARATASVQRAVIEGLLEEAFAVRNTDNMLALVDAIEATEPAYGPVDGSLRHSEDDFIEVECSGNDTFRNLMIKAVFDNPYSRVRHDWDAGFTFRDDDQNSQFRLVVASNSSWQLLNVDGSLNRVVFVQSAFNTRIDTTDDGSNEVILVANERFGLLMINGVFMTRLDLSRREATNGFACLGTGFFNNSELDGESTDFSDFTVWDLP